MSKVLLIYTTWPDAASAEAAGRAAVEARLCACVNILAPMTSIYRWNGAVEQAGETPMILKTTAAAADSLRVLLTRLHPYETPAIVALSVDAVASNTPFLHWIEEETAHGA